VLHSEICFAWKDNHCAETETAPAMNVCRSFMRPRNKSVPKTLITQALKTFAKTLAQAGIEPGSVEVSMSLDNWQHLARVVEDERFGAPVPGDIGQLEIAGVRYVVRFEEPRN
jgi:hypothetical protein